MKTSVQYFTKEKKLIVKGILVPEDLDSSEMITRMAIRASDSEQEFIVEMNSLGKELIKYKGSKAVLNGRLKDNDIGRKTIIVDRYEIHSW